MVIKTRDVNDVVIFDMEGEIRRPPTGTMETTVHQLVKSQLDRGKRKILLNFEGVGFIDSFGVGELLASYISTQNSGGKLKLAKISRRLELVMKITGLWDLFDPQGSEEAALEKFAKDC